MLDPRLDRGCHHGDLFLDEEAFGQAQGPVHARREIQIVGCEDGGDPFLAHEPQQLIEHLVGGVRIQIAGRFVREQNLGLVRDGAGNGDTLLLAAGQLSRAMVPAIL